jgi:uncharacterized protein involved in exopolysaccharide biosynthesis
MSSNLDSVSVERSARDIGLGEVLHSAVTSLWRRKLLVGAIVAIAVALGITAVIVIPPSYRPEAYIRGGFVVSNAVAKDEDSKTGPYVGLDLARVIETQSRLLQSHDLARRVVQQLGLEQLGPEVSESHWLPDWFYANESNLADDETNRAATRLLSRLTVTSDLLRTYAIEVRYTGKHPALAVVITNAFVAEFLRSSKLQTLAQERSSAEAALTRELDKLGDKHPRVLQAKVRLANADAMLKKQLDEAPEVFLQAAGENVTKAIAATTARRPNPRFVIGLFLLVGLVAGITVALRLERNNWAETLSQYVRPFA